MPHPAPHFQDDASDLHAAPTMDDATSGSDAASGMGDAMSENDATAGRADDAPPSKTRRKQQMHALQALGERLVKLPASQLERVPMPEELAQAVHEARRIKSHEGLRRQMQYIGKIMRNIDASAIEQALAIDEERHQSAIHLMHRAERWRDGLIDGSLSLTDFIDEHPEAAHLGLPALVAQARREKSTGKPPKQQRQLYRLLHDTLVQAMIDATGG